MPRIILVCMFLLGLFGNVSPAIAGVKAELSGNEVQSDNYLWPMSVEQYAYIPEMPYREGVCPLLPIAHYVNPIKVEPGSLAYQNSTLQTSKAQKSPVMEVLEEDNSSGVASQDEDSPSVSNETHITVETPNTVYVQKETLAQNTASEPGDLVSAHVMQAEAKERADESSWNRIAVIPMFGGLVYSGRWNEHIRNRYTFGLAVEAPISRHFSVEVEGVHGKYNISYASFGHNFTQSGIGGNAKLYLLRGKFSPYIGAGIMGTYFDDMSRGPALPLRYSQWLGSGQVLVGGDLEIASGVALGVRGAFLRPLFNRPVTVHNYYYSAPMFEEAAAIDTSYYRLMGALKVAF